MTKRTFNFNVIMNTSVRGRGKWGDFLVALIPVSWCCNILINSNFILRMIEWQNESSLFTIRIQGKQWYWVYKYDPNTAQAVMNTPKNVGHNRWRVTSGQESYNADTYYQAIHLAAHLEFQDSYSKFTKKIDTNRKNLLSLSLSNDKIYVPTNWSDLNSVAPTPLFAEEDIVAMENEILEGAFDNNFLDTNNDDWGFTETSFVDNYADDDYFEGLGFSSNLSDSNYVAPTPLFAEEDIVAMENEILEGVFDSNFSDIDINYDDEIVDTFDDNYADLPTLDISNKTKDRFFSNANVGLHEVYCNNNNYFSQESFDKFFNDQNNFNAYYDFLQLDETTDADSNSRHFLTTQPFRLLRGVLNQHVVDILQSDKFSSTKLNKLLFLNTKFSQTGEALADKELMPETLWGFRQKKYKRTKKFKFKAEVIYDPVTFEVVGHKALPTSPKIDIAGLELQGIESSNSGRLDSEEVSIKDRSRALQDNFNYRISARINRHRSELVPVTLARRLLRTKRTLVLPAHVNLTLITNSYDVVHSWFVPGLGLKIDCVPGRSTHHTFYIDNIGFYYGQCAEICGRYHHHMPIRLCALPFEHFVVWWQSKGSARMNRTSEISNNRFLQHKFNNAVTREKLIYRMN